MIKNKKPIFAVECKTGGKKLSPHIPYFKQRTTIPQFYQVHGGTSHRQVDTGIELLPFADFAERVGLAPLNSPIIDGDQLNSYKLSTELPLFA